MSALWRREALMAATGGIAQGDWAQVHGVSIDSRTLATGDLFVALTDQRDGHEFVASALAGGAGAALVSRVPDDAPEDARLLRVDDPLDALGRIAAAARNRAGDATRIAVTGSAGKTGVKEALRTVLAAQGMTHASEKSYNNHWGVPLTLARMSAATRFAVFEIGMNHADEITPLSRMVQPEITIITTIAPVHLGNFASEREIALAKAEIFDGLKRGGTALLPRDNAWYDLLAARAAAAGADIVSFGADASSDIRLIDHAQQPLSATVQAEIFGERVMFRLAAPGRHHALNSLAVLGAAKRAGAGLAHAALTLAEWKPGAGRGARQRVRLDPINPASAFELIDESYNANPASIRAAFETLSVAAPGQDSTGRTGRRIAVLGDMLELGPDSRALHAGLAGSAESFGIDRVHCCGTDMKALHTALPRARRGEWAPDSTALAKTMAHAVRAGDVVLVKGSLGSRMARIVETLSALGRRPRATPGHAEKSLNS